MNSPTNFIHDGLFRDETGFSVSPPLGHQYEHEIEATDYSAGLQSQTGLLAAASLELDEHLSMQSSSTGSTCGW